MITRLTCVHGLLQPVNRGDTGAEQLHPEPESSWRAAPAGILEAARQVLPLVCHGVFASLSKYSV